MNTYNAINDILVSLFNEINHIEEAAVITEEYKDISLNDMHIINAIGIREKRSMSAVANDLSVTVGTLTTATNSLMKKGYVRRSRSEKDRRVVLLSLSAKGRRAYQHHAAFHEEMVSATVSTLDDEEQRVLSEALSNLSEFFRTYPGKKNQS